LTLKAKTNDANITDLIILLGIILAFLLFPNLSKIKVANIELESVSIGVKNIELKPALSPMPSPLDEFRPPKNA
jgi:hypothetical protein